MTFSRRFYQTAAVCSVVSAGTTLLLIFLPRLFVPDQGFEARMARVHEPAYVLRAWAYLVHPFFTVAAALGVAARLRSVSAELVVPGFLCFLVWGATEAGQQALTLATFDPWRTAYLAGDEAVRASMAIRVAFYDGLWDAMYFLLLIAFLVGNALYALAMRQSTGLSRALSGFYAAATLLTASILIDVRGGPGLPPSLDAWIYPATQPLARTLIGVWLWHYGDDSMAPPVQSRQASVTVP